MALAIPRSSAPGPGMGAGGVDEGDHREAEALGELHRAAGFAVALGVGRPEIAPHFSSVPRPFAGRSRRRGGRRSAPARRRWRVVAERAVAVELDELVGHRFEQLEHPQADAGCEPAGRGSRRRPSGRPGWRARPGRVTEQAASSAPADLVRVRIAPIRFGICFRSSTNW